MLASWISVFAMANTIMLQDENLLQPGHNYTVMMEPIPFYPWRDNLENVL